MSITIIESMASGVPFICSDIPPHKEITQNGKGGIIFESKNHQELAKQIIELLTNKELYTQKQEEGLNLAKNYDWSNLAKEIEKEYQESIYSTNTLRASV